MKVTHLEPSWAISHVPLGRGGRARATVTDGGCWEWAGTISPAGYGQIRVGGRTRYAHRWVYELLVGPVPEGLQLDHLCRVRRCVNPAHLEPVTQAENVRRGIGFGTASHTHCPHGHEYTSENTLTRASTGSRLCRECGRIRNAANYVARKAQRTVRASA